MSKRIFLVNFISELSSKSQKLMLTKAVFLKTRSQATYMHVQIVPKIVFFRILHDEALLLVLQNNCYVNSIEDTFNVKCVHFTRIALFVSRRESLSLIFRDPRSKIFMTQ